MGLFYGFYRKPWLPTGAPWVIDIVSSGLLRLVALRSAYPLAAWITPNRGRDKKYCVSCKLQRSRSRAGPTQS
jgi:hypothetical protein